MADEKKYSVKTLVNYFGKKEGQDLNGFAKEMKELSEEEKIQLSKGIEDGSLTY